MNKHSVSDAFGRVRQGDISEHFSTNGLTVANTNNARKCLVLPTQKIVTQGRITKKFSRIHSMLKLHK